MRWSRVSQLLRWVAFLLFVAVVGGYEYYAVFVEQPDRSGYLPPAKDVHLTREVYGDCPLTQTFIVKADGFRGIEVYPRKGAIELKGPIRVRVLDGRGAEFEPMITRMLDVETLDLHGAWWIPVPRVDDSAGGLFMLEIAPDAASGGIRFEQGGAYSEGRLVINCQSDYGDLKFRVEVERATVFDNFQHVRRSLPAPLRSDAAIIAIAAIGNLALAVVAYSLAFASRPGAGPSDHSPKGNVEVTAAQPRV